MADSVIFPALTVFPFLLLAQSANAQSETMEAGAQPQNTRPATTYEGYPVTAMQEQREGTSGYVFSITDDGQMHNCQVTQSSGHADLDAATCPRLRRFPPPGIIRDEQGKAIKARYQGLMSWKLNQ
ncbi:MAG: TonB family protein [Sphingobium sp.]|nr:TonB family protein [Sphingobium sp.]